MANLLVYSPNCFFYWGYQYIDRKYPFQIQMKTLPDYCKGNPLLQFLLVSNELFWGFFQCTQTYLF